MKKEIYDINEISDSKEVYSQRPNPAIAAFVYCLVGLLAIAVIYAFFGKIDIVASAMGVVRPNDDISTVSSIIGGKIIEVNMSDGQKVAEGDLLFKVDTAESQVTLDSLEETKAEYDEQISAYKKFIKYADSGINPFAANKSSSEYPYYVEFQDYLLSLKSSKLNSVYDEDRVDENIIMLDTQIVELEKKIAGLSAYKKSIEERKNYCSDFPDYSTRYNLYISAIEALEQEYQSRRRQIETSANAQKNQYYITKYAEEVREYGYLVNSVKEGKSFFPTENRTVCRLFYEDYLANVKEYERSYQNAKETYEYYLKNSADRNRIDRAVGTGAAAGIGSDTDAGTGDVFSDYEISTAKSKMESAKQAIETYKNSKLIEFSQALSELEIKLNEMRISSYSDRSKSELLNELDVSYTNSKNQQYLKTLSETDSSLQTLKEELNTAKSNLKLNELARNLSKKSKDSNGERLSVSLASIEKLAAVLNKIDTLDMQLDEVNAQIKQLETQIKQAAVCASIDGVINAPSIIIKGDAIVAGTSVATIIPDKESAFKVQLYVGNADIGNVEVGDEVKYNLSAFPSNQYGILKGEVTSISKDVVNRDGGYSGYYLVEASIENKVLKDKNGNQGEIAVGMEAEAKIVTQKKRIIRYLMEKIDLF